MKLELRRFFENDDIRQDFSYSFNADDELISSDIDVEGCVKTSTGIVSVSAQAGLTVSTECAKCAKNITKKLSVPVEHLLIDKLNQDDNDDYIVVEDMVLDLDELILEDIYLSLPIRFLCKSDCKGLCPFCGKDLNDGACDCKKPVDPRLAALQALLDDEK